MDEAVGLQTFATNNTGVHGVLKMRPADFRVEEIGRAPALQERGRFTAIKVTMTDWETNRFVDRFARACKISKNRVWFSGTKDKKAITTQIMVVDAPRKRVEVVEMPDIEIEILGRTHQKAKLGDHSGNRFTITIRGCSDDDGIAVEGKEAMQMVNDIRQMMEQRYGTGVFPNWVGPQRFGTTRPVTAKVGEYVLDGDFESAVGTYLGMAGVHDREEIEIFRRKWRETSDVEACLEIIPKTLGYERRMLESLKKTNGDWVRSFGTLPRNLQLMTVHALQSMIFNHTLAARIESGLPLNEPVIGDLVAPLKSDGKADVGKISLVDETNIRRVTRNCALGRVTVTGPLPGSHSPNAAGEPGRIEAEVLERLGFKDADWLVEAIPRLSSKGTRRPLTSTFSDLTVEEAVSLDGEHLSKRWNDGPREGEIWNPDGSSLRLRFTLPPGTYATVLLREFMRVPSSQF